MNDRDWLVEIITEKDRIVFSFASYSTAEEFMRTAFLGLTNCEKEQIVTICISEERQMP